MRFAVNVAFLFTEVPPLERFEAAASAGFDAVETPWPQQPLDQVAAAIHDAGVELVQCNADAGDLAGGDRGYANDPDRVEAWRTAVDTALDWSAPLGSGAVNLLVGNRLPHVPIEQQWSTVRSNLEWALRRVQGTGRRLLVEVLNDRDTPDYLLPDVDRGAELVRSLDDPSLGLQFDTYHVALLHGDVAAALRRVQDVVAHVQLADAPDRHEPGTGRANLGRFLAELLETGYRDIASLEYVPSSDTRASLGWLPRRFRKDGVTDVADLRLS